MQKDNKAYLLKRAHRLHILCVCMFRTPHHSAVPCIEVVDGMISIIEGALIGTIVLTETVWIPDT